MLRPPTTLSAKNDPLISKVLNAYFSSPGQLADLLRNRTMNEMWALTQKYNTLNRRRWKAGVTYQLRQHQERMIQLVLNYGHDYARTPQQQWSFPAALMFTLRSVNIKVAAFQFHILPEVKVTFLAQFCIKCIFISVGNFLRRSTLLM